MRRGIFFLFFGFFILVKVTTHCDGKCTNEQENLNEFTFTAHGARSAFGGKRTEREVGQAEKSE